MAKYKTGQNVTSKKSGKASHIRMQDGNGRYILQNGENLYENEIEATPEPKQKRGLFSRKK